MGVDSPLGRGWREGGREGGREREREKGEREEREERERGKEDRRLVNICAVLISNLFSKLSSLESESRGHGRTFRSLVLPLEKVVLHSVLESCSNATFPHLSMEYNRLSIQRIDQRIHLREYISD